VRDSFDNAPFALALDTHILSSPLRYATGYNVIRALDNDHVEQSGFRFANVGSAPLSPYLQARLTDPTISPDGNWLGYEHVDGDTRQHIFFSQGRKRAVVHTVLSQHHQNGQRWIGMGMDHHQGWADGYAQGAFDTASSSIWGFAGIRQHYQAMTLAAELMLGQTRLNPKTHSLITSGQYHYNAFRLGTAFHLGRRTGIHLDLLLPPAVQSGQIHLNLPSQIDIGTGKTRFENILANLDLPHRERRADLMINHLWSDHTLFYAGISYRMNDGHRKGVSTGLIMLGINKTF
jgi:hypothetical protein